MTSAQRGPEHRLGGAGLTCEGLTGRGGAVGAGRGAATGPPGVALEVAIPLLATPLLLFPRGFLPLLGLAAITGLWLARWVVWRARSQANPLGLPILLFLVMAVQAVYPSTDISLSMPKLYGIVAGVAAYYGLVNSVRGWRSWWVFVAILLASTAGMAATGLAITAWNAGKMPLVGGIDSRVPSLLPWIRGHYGPFAGMHPGALGGVLAFMLPMPAGVTLWALGRDARTSPKASATYRPSRSLMLFLGLAGIVVASPTLVLAWSRSGFFAFGVAALVLLGLRWRRLGRVVAALGLVGIVAVGVVVAQDPSHRLVQLDTATSDSSVAAGRLEIWNRAGYMIQDFPFTGIGLGTFPVVLDTLYPSFLAGPDARIAHAHNTYLQTAVDLGIGGLMAFVGLWLIVGAQAVQAYRRARDPMVRGAVAGLAAGCAGYLVYGLTDSMALTEWEMPILWAMAGLIVAAARLETDGGTGGGGEGETENPELGPENSALSRQPSALSTYPPSPIPRAKGWAVEVGRAVWWTYWVVTIFFVAMAYVVDGIVISGWTP